MTSLIFVPRRPALAVLATLALGGLLLAVGIAPFVPTRPRSLSGVLTQIDHAAARIHSLEAKVISLKYTAVVKDTTVETGRFYYRATSSGPELALDITDPYPRIFIYKNDAGWIYQPQIKEAQKFDLRKNRAMVEQFLLLGLGGGGHALEKSFHVALASPPAPGGPAGTIELELTPLHPAALPSVSSIDLWYDPTLWLAVQQQINQPSGDYQRVRYEDVRVNADVSSKRFDTSFPGATIVTPQAP